MDLLIQESEWGQRSNMSNYENNEQLFVPSEEDFTFVQVDKKIYDKKFETKTTTFAKDAFKRFCKNKSSVVGAIIIGTLLLLSFLMPIIIPYNIDDVDPAQSLLEPKLFEAGKGFWDGTKVYDDFSWNFETNSPNGFSRDKVGDAVLEVYNRREVSTNTPKDTAYGGYLKFVVEQIKPNDTEAEIKHIVNYTKFAATSFSNTTVTLELGNVDNLEGKLGEYRITLISNGTDLGEFYNDYILDWTTDHVHDNGKITLNISEYLKKHSVMESEKTEIKIEMKRSSTEERYMLIKSLNIVSENASQEQKDLLAAISFNDANAAVLMQKDNSNNFPVGYWRSTGRRDLYDAKMTLVSFVYDTYEGALGFKGNFDIGGSEIARYVKNGWCEYDFKVGPKSFKVLDEEKCPIVAVHSQEYIKSKGVYNLKADVQLYKYKGFDKMPSYILGTTSVGKDLVKLAFVSLRTSLLIAIISSSICLCFGLVWGSISGYFGGNVDLAMERFCEILGGVPFIVVMTLTILLLGNNIVTFALALCLTGWLGVAGRTRTQFYRYKGREYILASRTLGSSDRRLIFRHILPNALGTIVTGSVLMIPSVIFSEASLAYLNLGLQGVESFGVLLSTNQKYLESQPALIIFPAIIISLLMISFNLFGNGLRDALNPSLKGSE